MVYHRTDPITGCWHGPVLMVSLLTAACLPHPSPHTEVSGALMLDAKVVTSAPNWT